MSENPIFTIRFCRNVFDTSFLVLGTASGLCTLLTAAYNIYNANTLHPEESASYYFSLSKLLTHVVAPLCIAATASAHSIFVLTRSVHFPNEFLAKVENYCRVHYGSPTRYSHLVPQQPDRKEYSFVRRVIRGVVAFVMKNIVISPIFHRVCCCLFYPFLGLYNYLNLRGHPRLYEADGSIDPYEDYLRSSVYPVVWTDAVAFTDPKYRMHLCVRSSPKEQKNFFAERLALRSCDREVDTSRDDGPNCSFTRPTNSSSFFDSTEFLTSLDRFIFDETWLSNPFDIQNIFGIPLLLIELYVVSQTQDKNAVTLLQQLSIGFTASFFAYRSYHFFGRSFNLGGFLSAWSFGAFDVFVLVFGTLELWNGTNDSNSINNNNNNCNDMRNLVPLMTMIFLSLQRVSTPVFLYAATRYCTFLCDVLIYGYHLIEPSRQKLKTFGWRTMLIQNAWDFSIASLFINFFRYALQLSSIHCGLWVKHQMKFSETVPGVYDRSFSAAQFPYLRLLHLFLFNDDAIYRAKDESGMKAKIGAKKRERKLSIVDWNASEIAMKKMFSNGQRFSSMFDLYFKCARRRSQNDNNNNASEQGESGDNLDSKIQHLFRIERLQHMYVEGKNVNNSNIEASSPPAPKSLVDIIIPNWPSSSLLVYGGLSLPVGRPYLVYFALSTLCNIASVVLLCLSPAVPNSSSSSFAVSTFLRYGTLLFLGTSILSIPSCFRRYVTTSILIDLTKIADLTKPSHLMYSAINTYYGIPFLEAAAKTSQHGNTNNDTNCFLQVAREDSRHNNERVPALPGDCFETRVLPFLGPQHITDWVGLGGIEFDEIVKKGF